MYDTLRDGGRSSRRSRKPWASPREPEHDGACGRERLAVSVLHGPRRQLGLRPACQERPPAPTQMSPEVSAQTSSSQPSLPSLVALHLAETFAVALGYAEIKFFHVLVLAQALGRAVHDDAAGFQDVAVGGVFERHVGVLLGEQEGDALGTVQLAHDLEDFLYDLGRKAHR